MGMFDIQKKSSTDRNDPEIVEATPVTETTSTSAGSSGRSKEELKLDAKRIDAAVQICKGAVEIGTGIIEIIRIRELNEADLRNKREQLKNDLARNYAKMMKDEQSQQHWDTRFEKNSRLYMDTLVFLNQSQLSKEESVAALEVLKEFVRNAFNK